MRSRRFAILLSSAAAAAAIGYAGLPYAREYARHGVRVSWVRE